MMRVMTAIVIELPTARRRHRPSGSPRRAESAALVDLAAYRRARSVRRRPRRDEPEHDDDEEEVGWAEGVHRVIDAAEELLAAGRAAEVVEFCTLATGCLGRNAAELGNPLVVRGLTERLGDLRTRACADG
jgi:hypothetical protein